MRGLGLGISWSLVAGALGFEPAPVLGSRGLVRSRCDARCLSAAAVSRRTAPLGPMPNQDIDVSNLERLEKYRSFDRYRRRAEEEAQAPHWWRTYREHFGEKTGAERRKQGLRAPASEPPASICAPTLGEPWPACAAGAGEGLPAPRWALLPVKSYQDFSPSLLLQLLRVPAFLSLSPHSELGHPSVFLKYSSCSPGHTLSCFPTFRW